MVEETPLFEMIKSLASNDEYDTAKEILESCNNIYEKEYIVCCRLYILYCQKQTTEFTDLYNRHKKELTEYTGDMKDIISSLNEEINSEKLDHDIQELLEDIKS